MTGLVDLDLVAAGEVQVARAIPVYDDLPSGERTFPTIKESTFKAKVKFYWREEQHGRTIDYFATCQICRDPMWITSDTVRSRLLVSTSSHKDRHWHEADGNTPKPLRRS